ncbi:MAG: tRNA (adenosine(37)-N6)-threonylcarbamoyltransferase complex ATPase subunit type 1 TsaE [Gammaproteobacteria bacterium]|nr:MAG: tRNA (adenosine(37)-N6)-threonylcarbamoyltransferase complex ATPase subunit type 1 TsaE [Gammaproteobacteria bacterium]
MAEHFLADEAETRAAGTRLANHLRERSWVIYLKGQLGAGKTTFARGLLAGLGHTGKVKSPSFTLLEPYTLEHWDVFHLDLYRLVDPEEVAFLGLRDLSAGQHSIVLVEWPEHGQGWLPAADLLVTLIPQDEGRMLHIQAESALGREALKPEV